MTLDWILLGLRAVSTLVLYTFLGLAFYIIWRDLKQAQTQAEARTFDHLRVLASEDDPSLVTGDIVSLRPVTLLGRNDDNTIVVQDGGASNRHARLIRKNGVWWLEDLGSRNGTLLNDLPLSKPASLANGDVITIGSIRFRLEMRRG